MAGSSEALARGDLVWLLRYGRRIAIGEVQRSDGQKYWIQVHFSSDRPGSGYAPGEVLEVYRGRFDPIRQGAEE